MRKLICITALAAAAVMAFVPTASAKKDITQVFLRNAFLTNGASMFDGDLAAFHNCGKRRVVTVYRALPGGRSYKVGKTRAKHDAGITYSWDLEKVGYAVKAGERYYAKVKPTKKCMGARSAAVLANVY